jgi:hypothetical protein
MVAAGRALASKEPEPLIQDPYAEPLVRAVGIDFFTKLVDGAISTSTVDDGGAAELITGMMAVRTRFFDDFFIDATGAAGAAPRRRHQHGAGIRAGGHPGLRARLAGLPAALAGRHVVYEIDQPRVIEAKTATMTEIGATPTADRRAWPSICAMTAVGADSGGFRHQPAHGVDRRGAVDISARHTDRSSTRSPRVAPGSTGHRVPPRRRASLGERANAVSDAWVNHGFDLKLTDLFYLGAQTGGRVSDRPVGA